VEDCIYGHHVCFSFLGCLFLVICSFLPCPHGCWLVGVGGESSECLLICLVLVPESQRRRVYAPILQVFQGGPPAWDED
jgi:hypothetical protein